MLEAEVNANMLEESSARLELNDEDDEGPPADIGVALDMIEGEVNANMPKEMEGGLELIGDEEAPTSHPEQMMSAEWNPEADSFCGIKKAAASSGIQESSPAELQQHHAVQPSTDNNAPSELQGSLPARLQQHHAVQPPPDDNARQMRLISPNVPVPSEIRQSSNYTTQYGSSAGAQPPPMPPPQSMLPDTSAPSIPLFHEVVATVVREMPVYDATPLVNDARPWWKKHRGCLLLGTGVSIAGLAVATALGLTRGPEDESAGLALVTTQPTESSAPSLVPSFWPSLRPSESVSPSMIPSFTPTFEPSQSGIPSTYPSPQPSTSFIPSSTPSKSLQPTTSFAPSQKPSLLPSSQPTRTKFHLIQQSLPGGASDDLRCIDLRAGDTENGNVVWYFPCNNTPGKSKELHFDFYLK